MTVGGLKTNKTLLHSVEINGKSIKIGKGNFQVTLYFFNNCGVVS